MSSISCKISVLNISKNQSLIDEMATKIDFETSQQRAVYKEGRQKERERVLAEVCISVIIELFRLFEGLELLIVHV